MRAAGRGLGSGFLCLLLAPRIENKYVGSFYAG